MRIPTVLALLIIILGLGVGIGYFYINQKAPLPTSQTVVPQGIQVVNITDTGATVIWETMEPAAGYVSFGDSTSLGSLQNDIRDAQNPAPHIDHFVTLANLTPATLYYFKVRSGPYFYPLNTLTFKTAQTLSATSLSDLERNNKAIAGVVLQNNLSPVDEALIILHIAGVSPIAALSSKAGNFILPTVYLYKDNFTESYVLDQKITAQLTAKHLDQISQVTIALPIAATLPKIILGQNSDFTNLAPASESAKLTSEASSSASCKPNFDLNNDKKVNSVDLTILLDHIGEKSSDKNFLKQADFDCDGVIDQKDVDLIKKSMAQ